MTVHPVLLDSITDADENSRGAIVVSGSHGGLYPAAIASRAGVRAVLFNDAGVGLEDAGVAGVLALSDIGLAAAAVDCRSARIGDSADMIARGRLSRINPVAAGLGLAPGQAVSDALALLASAGQPAGALDPVAEARRARILPNGQQVWLLDSASLVKPEDDGAIVITGSHGGLIGGDPARAIKAPVRAAIFNDAGTGMDGAGLTRLPALDQREIAGVTVDCNTARIGDGASALATGVISHANNAASAAGAVPGQPLMNWLCTL